MRSIKQFAEHLIGRINLEFDTIVTICSGTVKGTGKSVFSIKLAKEICKIIKHPFSYDLIIFNPTSKKLIEKVKALPDGCPIIIDEAIRVLYKRDFQKEYQKELITFINICRKFKKVILLNVPDFWDLDKDIRNLTDYQIVIIKRGLAQVRGKTANPDAKDKWMREESIKRIDKAIKGDETNLIRTRSAIRETIGFQYNIPFKELENREEYDEYVKLSKEEEVQGLERKIAKEKIICWILPKIAKEYNIKLRDLAVSLNKEFFKSIFWDGKTEKGIIGDSTLSDWKSFWESRVRTPQD